MVLPLEATFWNVVDNKVPVVLQHVVPMLDVTTSINNILKHTADTITYNNTCCHPGAIAIGCSTWLSTEYLKLPYSLSHKFSPWFIGSFPTTITIIPVSFLLTLPKDWHIYKVFYVS